MKSYWQSVSVRTDKQKKACLSWFGAICAGMTVESAEILLDAATDREKKLRAVVVGTDGVRRTVTRTLGKQRYTVSLRPL